MHIGLLVTNTDDSDFAARHPRDAEKFATLLAGVRPGWDVSAFDLPKGEFPDGIQGFDGFVIGGSPASVRDDTAWIARLMDLIRTLADALGVEPTIELLPMQPGDVPATYADISRIRAKLGFEPTTPIARGIPAFAAWYRAHPHLIQPL